MGTVRYNYYRDVFNSVPMPVAFGDLDCFDANIHAILARANGKFIRVASKSLRCVKLLRRILTTSNQFRGNYVYFYDFPGHHHNGRTHSPTGIPGHGPLSPLRNGLKQRDRDRDVFANIKK